MMMKVLYYWVAVVPSALAATDLGRRKIHEKESVVSRTATFESRIVGGTTANPGEFPFFVQWEGCGGSLIHSDIMLSAAHCNVQPYNDVYVGAYKSESTADGAQKRTIVARSIHPEFNSNTLDYDYLVMKLDSPVSITPVVLNSNPNYPTANEVLTVIGFGVTQYGAPAEPTTLRVVNVDYVSPQTCNNDYGGGISSTLMLCAGVPGGGKDSCQGDSGGPIMDANNVLLGSVSFGDGCAQADYPGVYSRVTGGLSWINQQICDLSSDPPASCNSAAPVKPTRAPVKPTRAPVPPPTPPPTRPPTPRPSVATTPSPSPPFGVTSPDVVSVAVQIDIQYDYYADETSWILVSSNGQTIASSPLGAGVSNKLVVTNLHLTPGTYILELSDSYGDGFCCAYGDGYFKVIANINGVSDVLADGYGQFNYQKNATFQVPLTFPTPSPVQPSPSPLPPSPTSSPLAGDACRDLPSSFTYNLTIGGIFTRGKRSCSWLSAHSNYRQLLCRAGQQAYTLCPQTCGRCLNACEGQDSSTATFTVSGAVRDCAWLSIRPSLWPKLCLPNKPAYIYCKDVCNSC